MQFCLLGVLLRNQKDPCGWMWNNRIWYHAYTCAINESWNLQAGPLGVPSGLDLSVINAMTLFQEPRADKCIFSIVGLNSAGSLNNGVIVVNATIDMSKANATACTELYVSPFDNINGTMNNITVVGFINITNLNGAQFNTSVPFRLGKFFGNLNFTGNTAGGNRYVGGPMLKNLSSSVQYSINGINVANDNQTMNINANTFTIRYVNEFESTMPTTTGNASSYTISIGTATPLSTLVSSNVVYKQMRYGAVFGRTSNVTIAVYTGFATNTYANAMNDMYMSAIQRQAQLSFATANMTWMAFDGAGNQVFMPQTDINTTQLVYWGPTKMLALIDNNLSYCNATARFLTVWCQGTEKWDVVLQQCTTPQACLAAGRFLFASMCMVQCPPNLYQTIQACFAECPFWLGWAQPTDGSTNCQQCVPGQFATVTGCTTTCPSLVFGTQGCYTSCPEGSLQVLQTCVAPNATTNCTGSTPYYADMGLFDAYQFYNSCLPYWPGEMYLVATYNGSAWVTGNEFDFQCNGLVTNKVCRRQVGSQPSSCDTTQNTTVTEVAINATSTAEALCLWNCLESTNNSGVCNMTCPMYFVQSLKYGSCDTCLTVAYDGGTTYSMGTQKCINTFCKYITYAGPYTVCEDVSDPPDPVRCPNWYVINATSNNCTQTCNSSLPFSYNRTCSSSCPGVAPFVQSAGNFTCIASCSSNLVYINGTVPQCMAACLPNQQVNNTTYGNSTSKQCQNCTGQFVQRANLSCVSACSYINYSYPTMCELNTDTTNCPMLKNISGIQYCISLVSRNPLFCNQQRVMSNRQHMYCNKPDYYGAIRQIINQSINFDVTNNTMVMTYSSVFFMAQTLTGTFVNATITAINSQQFAISNFKGFTPLTVMNCTLYANLTLPVSAAALIAIGGGQIQVNSSFLNFTVNSSNSTAGIALFCYFNLTVSYTQGIFNFSGTNTNNVSTMIFNNTGSLIKINATNFTIISNTDFCTLVATQSILVPVNVFLNMSYFTGNISGNNLANLGLVVGAVANSSSYLLINNTYICVRAWIFNMFSLGTTNATPVAQILQTNVSSWGYVSGSNYYMIAGTSFNNTQINMTSSYLTSSSYNYSLFLSPSVLFWVRINCTMAESAYPYVYLLSYSSTALTSWCVQINANLYFSSASTSFAFFQYSSTGSSHQFTTINLTANQTNYGAIQGLMYSATSGTTTLNSTTFTASIGSAGSSYFNLGVYYPNSGALILMQNTLVNVTIPAQWWGTYFSIFSYNVYNTANLTIVNATANLSNGTNFAYMYGPATTSYIYFGAVYQAYTSSIVLWVNSTVCMNVYFNGWSANSGMIMGYIYTASKFYASRLTTLGQFYCYYTNGAVGGIFGLQTSATVVYNDSQQLITMMYELYSNNYFGFLAQTSSGSFTSYNVKFTSSIYVNTSQSYEGLFGYYNAQTFGMYNWSCYIPRMYGAAGVMALFSTAIVTTASSLTLQNSTFSGTMDYSKCTAAYQGVFVQQIYQTYFPTALNNVTFMMTQIVTYASAQTGLVGYHLSSTITWYFVTVGGMQNLTYNYFISGLIGQSNSNYVNLYNITVNQTWFVLNYQNLNYSGVISAYVSSLVQLNIYNGTNNLTSSFTNWGQIYGYVSTSTVSISNYSTLNSTKGCILQNATSYYPTYSNCNCT